MITIEFARIDDLAAGWALGMSAVILAFVDRQSTGGAVFDGGRMLTAVWAVINGLATGMAFCLGLGGLFLGLRVFAFVLAAANGEAAGGAFVDLDGEQRHRCGTCHQHHHQ